MKELFALDKKDGIKHWTVEVEGDEVVVRHGKYQGKMQERRTKCTGKNIGRANETTPQQQAALEAESKYNKQVDKMYRPTIEGAKNVGNVLPMLAKNYLDSGHRITYPCYTSPKLDGVRCIARITNGEVVLHSRGGKPYDCPAHISKELLKLSAASGVTIFDGELYIHGKPLQDIVSCVKKHNTDTPLLMYWIFDVPSDLVWTKRLSALDGLNEVWVDPSVLTIVPNSLVASESDAEFELDKWVSRGYEGVMLRNKTGMYEYNHRSADLQKWKRMQDDEAKVTGVEKDKSDEGVLICVMKSGVEFKCKMKGTHAQRAYQEQLQMVGKWITFKYQALTKDGVPQFPVGVCVRNCDDNGNPIE